MEIPLGVLKNVRHENSMVLNGNVCVCVFLSRDLYISSRIPLLLKVALDLQGIRFGSVNQIPVVEYIPTILVSSSEYLLEQ